MHHEKTVPHIDHKKELVVASPQAEHRLALLAIAEQFAQRDNFQKGLDFLTDTESTPHTLDEIDDILIQTVTKEKETTSDISSLSDIPNHMSMLFEAAKSAYALTIAEADEDNLYPVTPNFDHQSNQWHEASLLSQSPHFAEILKVLERPELINSTDELIATIIRCSEEAGRAFQHSPSNLDAAQRLIRARAATARLNLLARDDTPQNSFAFDALSDLADTRSAATSWEAHERQEDTKQRLLRKSETLRDMLYEFGGYGYSVMDDEFYVPNLKTKEDVAYWAAECGVQAALIYDDPRELAAVKQIIRSRAEQAQEHLPSKTSDNAPTAEQSEGHSDNQSTTTERTVANNEPASAELSQLPDTEEARALMLFLSLLESGAFTRILKGIGGTSSQLATLKQIEKDYKDRQERNKTAR